MASSIYAVYICESELDSIDMISNTSKSNSLGIDPCWNYDVTNVKLATRNGASIDWCNGCRNFGIFVTSEATFKCKFDGAKAKLSSAYRTDCGSPLMITLLILTRMITLADPFVDDHAPTRLQISAFGRPTDCGSHRSRIAQTVVLR